jgi:hypothetical protein
LKGLTYAPISGKMTLYRKDGSQITARKYYLNNTERFAEGGILTYDNRRIFCRDEQRGIFSFADTHEELYLADPSTQS